MKNHFIKIALLSLIVLVIAGCAQKKSEHDEHSKGWPEMDAFHFTMAEAYHPFKDSANLKPAKASAALLATDASKWASSKLPEKMDNSETKEALAKLSTDAKSFEELVKTNTPDDELGKKLTALHEEFHAIMEHFHGEKH